MKRNEVFKKYIKKLDELNIGWGLYDEEFNENPDDRIGFIVVDNKPKVFEIFKDCKIQEKTNNFVYFKLTK